MKLITELHFDDVDTVEESVNGQKNLYITGVYLQSGVKNRNGRWYDPTIMERAVNDYIEGKVNRRMAYGELNHPNTPALNPERYSHRIVELKRVGNDWHGKSLVMNTPQGNIVRGILESGGIIGVSSRGMGTLRKSGDVTYVGEDFRLATAADIVSDPSAPDAFVNGIMEGLDWVYDERNGWQAIRIAEQIREQTNKNAKALTEEDKLRAFKLFVEHVKNVDFTA